MYGSPESSDIAGGSDSVTMAPSLPSRGVHFLPSIIGALFLLCVPLLACGRGTGGGSDLSATVSNCTIGVDLATPVSVSAFECLIQERGVQFLTVRAFQSNCYVDPHAADTIRSAWAAGIEGVDVYFFPSVGCSLDAVSQLDATLAHLQSHNATFNRLFFDVENWAWSAESECDENIEWFAPLFAHAQDLLGVERVGIYTTGRQWQQITCDSEKFSSALLWYASWNDSPSFANFVPFGGWDQPFAKQFTGNDFACDIHLDFDYRESGEC